LTRAGEYEKPLLRRAVEMFEVFLFCIYQPSADGMKDFLLYLNHVGLCTEEISEAGDACVKSLFLSFELWRLNSCFKDLEMQSRGSRTFLYIHIFDFC
jgi:hypothetical protein